MQRWTCVAVALSSLAITTLSVPVGLPCSKGSDCSGGNSTTCLEGLCECQPGYVQAPDKNFCVRQAIGRSCISTTQVCGVSNSYCDNGVCACVRPDFVPSYNKTMCLPVVTALKAPCDEDQQCMNELLGQDTRCINKECVCRFGPTNVSKACQVRKRLDDWCTHTQQCRNIDHASCVQGRCACDPYFVPYSNSRNECIPIATRLGAPCRQHVQCTAAFGEGGECGEGSQCRCQHRFHFVHNRTLACVLTRGLQERCSVTDECWLPLDGYHQHTDCQEGACVCGQGFEPADDGQRCSGVGRVQSVLSSFHLLLVTVMVTVIQHNTL